MCGIAGYIGTRELAEERLLACRAQMRRRGPDGDDHRHFTTPTGKHVYLIHSRLRIIDLDPRANQPFQAGHKWIAFNGELYNYIEVRRELAEAGESFRTTSDTEVLVKALDRLGEEVLDRCEGMWAFAVYDEADGSVTLSRDRFGEKPLFLYRTEDGLYFASEVKFLLALLGRRLPVNYDHLYRYLVNGYKALYKERHTFFQGLEELPSGHVMRVEADGTTSSRRYWTPEVHLDERMTWEEAVQGTRERLLRAVEIRLRADVPLAFCMSGGVDSNGLISIAKKVFDYDVHGFTIMNSDARYDEQELVEHTIQQLGIRHTPIPVDVTEFLARMRTLVNYHDSPVSTISYYAHWLLMGSIAEHGYRISISGSAADELFTGYYDHHLAYLYEVRNDPDWHALSQRNWETHILPVVRNPFLRNPDLFIQDPAFRDHIFLDAEGFAAYLTQEWFEPFAESRYCDSLLRNRMLNELFHEAVPVILHEDDHNAMFYSIENRSPYLDRPLFEFCNTIPSRHLMRNGMAKAVLREALRGIAPDRVIDNRTKVGFNAPIYSFLDVNNPEVRSALLDPSPVFDIVRRPKIEELIARPDLPNSQSKFLFYFISTKMFLEEFAA